MQRAEQPDYSENDEAENDHVERVDDGSNVVSVDFKRKK